MVEVTEIQDSRVSKGRRIYEKTRYVARRESRVQPGLSNERDLRLRAVRPWRSDEWPHSSSWLYLWIFVLFSCFSSCSLVWRSTVWGLVPGVLDHLKPRNLIAACPAFLLLLYHYLKMAAISQDTKFLFQARRQGRWWARGNLPFYSKDVPVNRATFSVFFMVA